MLDATCASLAPRLLAVRREPLLESGTDYHIEQLGNTVDNVKASIVFHVFTVTILKNLKKFCYNTDIRTLHGISRLTMYVYLKQ